MKALTFFCAVALIGGSHSVLRGQTVAATGSEWGPVNAGLRMAARPAMVGRRGRGEWQVDVAIENVGDTDALLSLGFMVAHVMFPQSVRLILTDRHGRKRELEYGDPRYPHIGSRVDDFIVFLRTGSTYTLRLSWDRYWSPETHEYDMRLAGGEYRIEARFDGRAAQWPREIAVMNFWQGTLRSQPMVLTVR
jgi:hypothetical protein